jgi:SAM-dependent methyltransferase
LPYDAPPIADYLVRFYGGSLDTSALDGEDYQLCACASCDLVFQLGVPDEGYLSHLYEAAALADPSSVAAARGLAVRQAYATDIELVIQHARREPHDVRVLDHGAGTGLWLQMAAAYGCTTAGTEFSQTALDRLETAGHLAFHPGSLPTESFDFINSEQVFEHLVEPATALAQLVQALRPGGLIRLSVPNGTEVRALLEVGDWSAPKGSATSLNAVAPLEHLNCFTPRTLRQLAAAKRLDSFRFPLRQLVQPSGRIRSAAGAVRARVRPRPGTLQWFRKPG